MTEGTNAPILIGGSNGSGTRVYARLLEIGGVFQGRSMNYAFEPDQIIQHTRNKVPGLIEATKSVTYDINALPDDIREVHSTWIGRFARDIYEAAPEGCQNYGWKHPRNLFILPLCQHLFSEMKFVHVVRDGRDMALARNKGDFLALKDFVGNYSNTPADAAAFWSFMNIAVSEWCTFNLAQRYVVTKFEDLCGDPVAETRRIFTKLGLCQSDSIEEQSTKLVQMPSSISRWKSLPPDEKRLVEKAARQALLYFGYTK